MMTTRNWICSSGRPRVTLLWGEINGEDAEMGLKTRGTEKGEIPSREEGG